MTDIVLDTATHDLLMDGNDIVLFESLEELTVQKVKINLLNYRGEWFRDINAGMPYLQQIMGKRDTKSTADTVIRTTITETENISNITSYTSSLSVDRKLVVTFSAIMTSGGVIDNVTLEI